jgi:RNA polymerase sigma-70 factor (ECF subfamily)
MDEDKLLKECLSGNTRAQKLLYERYASKMFGVCLRYAANQSMAEDFLQEGFIRVFMKLGSFRSQGSLEGWMRRIMVNTALEQLRKKDILKNTVELDNPALQHVITGKGNQQYELLTVSDPDNSSEDNYMEQFTPEVIYKALSEMPVGFRTVFNLFAVEEYTHKEIGSMLSISEGTSKSQYARARIWLQKKLSENKSINDERKQR